jgi:hypothetical protein
MGRRVGLALGLVLLVAGSLRAEVQISHICAATGPFWPTKKDHCYYPGDSISFRYLVTGLKTDPSDFSIDATVTWTITDSDNKLAASESKPWSYHPVMGNGTAPHITAVEVNERFKPGDYHITVVIKDNHSGSEASFKRPVTIKPEEWAIAVVAFYRDPEGRIPGCLNANLGEQLYYKMKIIGYEKERLDCEMHLELLDEDGKDVIIKPFTQVFVNNNAKLIQSVPFLRAEGAVPTFTRPGDFTLKITVTDHVKERTATWEAPVRISPVP